MRSTVSVTTRRRTLCVFPAYTPSFGTFSHAYPLMGGVKKASCPRRAPVIAAYMPESWEYRFIDENIRRASAQDFAWADAVFVSGMHIQEGPDPRYRPPRPCGRQVAVLGGPSVSGRARNTRFRLSPCRRDRRRHRPLIERLDADVAGRPPAGRVRDRERLALSDFPAPAYEAAPLKRYLIGSLQFSSWLPVSLRVLRHPAALRPPAAAEDPRADVRRARRDHQPARHPAVVYFVDDNFIANRKATREMLPISWVAEEEQLPAPVRLRGDAEHGQAARDPRADAPGQLHDRVRRHRDAGGGRAQGHRQDPQRRRADVRGDRDPQFLRARSDLGHHPGPRFRHRQVRAEPDRLHRQVGDPGADHQPAPGPAQDPALGPAGARGPAVHDAALESNVLFKRPHDTVVASWRRAIAHAYEPEQLSPAQKHQCQRHLPEPHQDADQGQAHLHQPGRA